MQSYGVGTVDADGGQVRALVLPRISARCSSQPLQWVCSFDCWLGAVARAAPVIVTCKRRTKILLKTSDKMRLGSIAGP